MSNKRHSKKQQKKKKTVKSQAGEICFDIKLTFQAPFISQASGVMAMGLDAAMQRNSDDIPVINGSLVRGNILHALKEFQQSLDDDSLKQNITSWFGESSTTNEKKEDSYKPQRANADFDFYWILETEESVNQQRTRIAINDSGTVKQGALQVIEDCFPTGSDNNPVFRGKIRLRYKLGDEPKKFETWLGKALQYIPAMGSFKGVGFGKLLKASVKKDKCKQENQQPISPTVSRFGLTIEIDRPFCIGRPVTPDSNRIVSEEYIAGNVIKALIARTYHNDEKKLQEELCFDDIIISHALPAVKNQPENKPERNTPLALSLALQKENNKLSIVDMVDKTEDIFTEAPSFAIDWKPKDRKKVCDLLKRTEISLDKIIMLRTGIDAEKGISKENTLFSLECIEPRDHVWCADIDLVNVPEKQRQQVLGKLQTILRKGLNGMGKTKARVTITLQAEPFVQVNTTATLTLNTNDASHYVVSLTTAAKLLPHDMQISGTNGDKALETYYQQYWHQIDKSIELKHYFAQQTLTSTYYHTQMHQPLDKYYPQWLTDAGSVFVLEINNEKALKALQDCLSQGLPTYCDNKDNPPSWRDTPFLPEHGYGEIQIKKQGENQ